VLGVGAAVVVRHGPRVAGTLARAALEIDLRSETERADDDAEPARPPDKANPRDGRPKAPPAFDDASRPRSATPRCSRSARPASYRRSTSARSRCRRARGCRTSAWRSRVSATSMERARPTAR
jgi:hypothetical protein